MTVTQQRAAKANAFAGSYRHQTGRWPTRQQVADYLGISYSAAGRVISVGNVPLHRQAMPPAGMGSYEAVLRNLVGLGCSRTELQYLTGYVERTIIQHLKHYKLDVPKAPRGHRPRKVGAEGPAVQNTAYLDALLKFQDQCELEGKPMAEELTALLERACS